MVTLFGIVFTILLTFPLVWHLDGFLVYILDGQAPKINYDAMIFVRYLSQMSNTLLSDTSSWDVITQNRNFDMPPTYAFGGGILAIFLPALVAHNLFLLGSTFLSYLCMYLFCQKTWDPDREVICFPAILAGLAYGFSNYQIHHFYGGHGNQVQLLWIPLVFYFIEKHLGEGSLKTSISLGIIVGLLVLSNTSFSLGMTVLLPIYVLVRKPSILLEIREIAFIVVSITVAIIISGYYILIKLQQDTAVYSLQNNLYFSINSLYSLVDPSGECHIGFMVIIMALGALPHAFRIRERRVIALFILFMIAVGMMFGPRTALAPYSIFYKYWPLADHTRTPLRFVAFALFAAGGISSYGYYVFAKRLKRPLQVVVFASLLCVILGSHYLMSHYHVFDETGRQVGVIDSGGKIYPRYSHDMISTMYKAQF